MKLGLITSQAWPTLIDGDKPIIGLLARHDIVALPLVWDDESIDWQGFDALVMRSPWDYFEKYPSFSAWLNRIEALGIPTYNSIKTIKYNIDKAYLRDLESKGIDIVPSLWINKQSGLLEEVLDGAPWPEMVIKPTISAGSFLTTKFSRAQIAEVIETHTTIHQSYDLVLQPFLPEIVTKGEVSLLYFGGKFSHAVIKKPSQGDFRIQSQYGGIYTQYQPNITLQKLGLHIANMIDPHHLYARVDMIELGNVHHVMEVEMIEPDLYFSIFPDKISTFIDTLVGKIKAQIGLL
jgi:glutathione synthase/RimK-type ligase-like ATP-grasp enzyme